MRLQNRGNLNPSFLAEVICVPPSSIQRIVNIMAALRDPDTGCPWDLKQDFKSIAPYALEEAYEVVDAIETGDMDQLRDELGDLLLQVVFHARMAEEAESFTFDDVVNAIADKMERRHPHVFGAKAEVTSEQVKQNWEDMKAQERAAKSDTMAAPPSLLDDVPLALPAMTRAVKLQKRAARIGFDWTEPEPIFDKLEEEVNELREAMALKNADAIEDELGDVLFVVANIARHLKLDPETALRRGNAKFSRRFQQVEQQARAQSTDMSDFSLDDLESFWQRAKAAERKDD
jgi:MazG family protein